MKLKVSEATPAQLDWMVAKCENVHVFYSNIHDVLFTESYDSGSEMQEDAIYAPSTNWAQGGPIIEREGISLRRCEADEVDPDITHWWIASEAGNNLNGYSDEELLHFAPTPLIAAMRCYVTSKLGGEVEVPEELR